MLFRLGRTVVHPWSKRYFWLTGLCILAAASPCWPATYSAFGPETFLRQGGAAVTESRTFSIENPEAKYTLLVYNKGLKRELREVRNVRIEIDGAIVVAETESLQGVTALEREITLDPALQLHDINVTLLDPETRGRASARGLALVIVGVDDGTLLPVGNFWAYGPADFVRAQGPATTELRDFTTLDPSADYLLLVNNGGSNDQYRRAESATLEINGADILQSKNFGAEVSLAAKPVPLSDANQLALTIRSSAVDEPNHGMTLQIVGLDHLLPSIVPTVFPAANSYGWHHTNPTVSFTCSDATSGVAICSGPQVVSTEGAGQIVTGEALDHARNPNTVSVVVNLDKTPPTLGASVAPPANSSNWNKTDVILTWTCNDSLSGIESCPSASPVSGEGDFLFSATATDRAGNRSEPATYYVHIDETPPTITATVNPSPNANNWNNTPVDVDFVCNDSRSGVEFCGPDQSRTSEGANQQVNGEARDVAGNITPAAPVFVNIDTIPPDLSGFSPASGSSVSDPALLLTASAMDATSGVGSATCDGQPATVAGSSVACGLTLSPGQNVITVTATDLAGNSVTRNVTITLQDAAPFCGDSNVDPGEECDDGNTDPNDGCANCRLASTDPADDPDGDWDGDGLTNWEELNGCRDFDRDRVCDPGTEFPPTDPLDADTDGDLLSDLEEVIHCLDDNHDGSL